MKLAGVSLEFICADEHIGGTDQTIRVGRHYRRNEEGSEEILQDQQ